MNFTLATGGLLLIFVISACKRLPEESTVFSTVMASGSGVRVYRLGFYDTAFLGLEVSPKSKAPSYYWVSMSPDVEFGQLSIRAELTPQKDTLFISGTSKSGSLIYAAYDDRSDKFYSHSGVATDPSDTAEMGSMLFVPAPFPAKLGNTAVVFDGAVKE